MIVCNNRGETIALGQKVAAKCAPGTIIALQGQLGSGKTTLVQGIALGLGIQEIITSPTFVIIAEYDGPLPLYHFDLYRLSSSTEFEDLGAEELLYGQGLSVIEWSERITDILPEGCVKISITITGPETRTFAVEGLDL